MENSTFYGLQKGQFDVVELMVINQYMVFSINLKAPHVNGMTHFDQSDKSTYNIAFWRKLNKYRKRVLLTDMF